MTRHKKTAAREEITEQQSIDLLAQITRMINAWEKHAPNEIFAGMTVASASVHLASGKPLSAQ